MSGVWYEVWDCFSFILVFVAIMSVMILPGRNNAVVLFMYSLNATDLAILTGLEA